MVKNWVRGCILGTVLALILLLAGCMGVPPGTHLYVSDVGCTSNNVCPWSEGAPRAFYFAPMREMVVPASASLKVQAHELCHAHQHETILEETGREPTFLNLREWLDTREGILYSAVVEAHPRPEKWNLSADNTIEDFAEACARYLTNWQGQDPARDQFFAERGFK